MAGRNYYVLSVLCTDKFWTGDKKSPLGDLGLAVKYLSYQSATEDVVAFKDITRISNIEIRQMIEAGG